MTAQWRTHAVVPTGSRTAAGFACRSDGSAVHNWEEPVWPPSRASERLRAERVRLGLGLRQAARLLEMTASDLSDLEAGRTVFDDDADGARAMILLRAEDCP